MLEGIAQTDAISIEDSFRFLYYNNAKSHQCYLEYFDLKFVRFAPISMC